jgi:YbbR domain-containing protein
MFKFLRENLVLKVVSLMASLSLWLYVTADRYPNTSYTRSVNADVLRTGNPPSDVIVRIRQEPLPVEISGPRTQVDGIDDNEIKAEVDVRSARAGATQLKIVKYRKPAAAPGIEIKGRQYVSVDVLPKARKLMAVTPMFNTPTSPASRYGTPRLKPEWATVSGAADDVRRVARLVVSVETSGQPVSADLPIRAEDRDNVEIAGVEVAPATAHVEVALEQPPATRNLVVSVLYRGNPAPGHLLSEIVVEPSTVTVVGKPEQIQALSNVVTREVNIEGISGEIVRQVMLSPPEGVGLAGGRPSVRVTFRTQEIAKPPASGGA